MERIYNTGNCTIATQELHENSTAINAGTYNNIIFDDPFRYYSEIKLKQNSELENKLKLIELFIQKDILKKRFLGSSAKYEELMDEVNNSEISISSLDDGYKSIISCIINVSQYFKYPPNNEGYLYVNGNDYLLAKITVNGLSISYSDTIETYQLYIETTKFAEELIKKIIPYIRCATTYGNFFQFGDIFITKIGKVPFIPKEVVFSVSNDIIPNLIKPLYGDSPECGLREIIQNACDATKELPDVNLLDKHIDLIVVKNEDKTVLTIRDYGIGMTEDILLNKYFVIGESSKKGNTTNLVGQFGIGALAAFLLGDKIAVKTKHYKSTSVYTFDYELTSKNNNSIAVSIKEDEDFACGTEVSIVLKDSLSKLDQSHFQDELKINEWYVLPDVAINYFYDGEKQKIVSFVGQDYLWLPLSDDNKYNISYLDKPNTILNKGFQIIYNGLMVPEPYNPASTYLKMKPYIAVSSSSHDISLNLERSKIESGLDLIKKPLEAELISKGLKILVKEKNNIIGEDGTILSTTYNNEYIKDIPLFFTNEGFGILNSNYYISDFIEVYGYNGHPKLRLSDLDSNKKYIFNTFTPDKSSLATLIEVANGVVVDNEEIKRYFYNAINFNYGFKTETMKYLYKNAFSQIYAESLNAQKFWEQHNERKERDFEQFFDEPQNICLYKNMPNYDFMDEIKEKTNGTVVAYFTYLRYTYCDSRFDIGIVSGTKA
ncbi:ATP-binding protein [Anaerotignum propionicum]|uniref:Chaperone protein HtpG n=1 Tax=Anaerotignum propionicum DSM 1682 TaxID=991789 RepID=A0A0X1U7U2_ANAPI|nr:ATP-binding protein [Anaerotignum propionicum]AMJ41009.1 chaperone protein HtpG [Anaerotignum propionicum DSM 1682]SHE61213.1 Histidine kinase-, DNA gyrase B-, and HSP90-like ATPase [[Clostridium] propionicum DSM 1682] [Anaerotignum propionicum DSM 1682]